MPGKKDQPKVPSKPEKHKKGDERPRWPRELPKRERKEPDPDK